MSKPLFQKRHYELVAKTIRNFHESVVIGDANWMTEELVKMFRADNPKFDEAKFWRAINEK